MALHVRRSPTIRVDGDKTREIRESKGLTQLYVAEVVGVSVDTVSRWENNRTPAVKRDNAEALARALEVDLNEILRSGPPEEEETATDRPQRVQSRGRPAIVAIMVAVAAALAATAYWYYAAQPPLVVEAFRRLPAYTPPGTEVPVIVHVRITSGQGRNVILRETLPTGWELAGASPSPDQGPTPDRTVKWILPIHNGPLEIAYLARTPPDAKEGTAFRFTGEVVTPGKRRDEVPVRGETRIDLEYLHWADSDADFQISDAEVLDALERLEIAAALGLDPADLRRLWGAPEYAWDESKGRFLPERR